MKGSEDTSTVSDDAPTGNSSNWEPLARNTLPAASTATAYG